MGGAEESLSGDREVLGDFAMDSTLLRDWRVHFRDGDVPRKMKLQNCQTPPGV